MQLQFQISRSICNSVSTDPAAFSLITDYFPDTHRGIASSIYNAGIYIGGSLSSIIGASKANGGLTWQQLYVIFGCAGGVAGVILIVVVRDPPRGMYKKHDIAVKEIADAAAAAAAADEDTQSQFGNDDEALDAKLNVRSVDGDDVGGR
jgi:sugar phosphate permease